MMQSPATSFGFFASTIALKAKGGQLTDRGRADLAQKLLEFVPDDKDARVAVVAFMTTSREFPVVSGDVLLKFICDWMGDRHPKDVEQVLAQVGAAPEYEWQKRVDLQ